jgi:hypothetical protein
LDKIIEMKKITRTKKKREIERSEEKKGKKEGKIKHILLGKN